MSVIGEASSVGASSVGTLSVGASLAGVSSVGALSVGAPRPLRGPAISVPVLPTMLTESIPLAEQAEQKNRLHDRDGKYFVAFNKITIVVNLANSSPFRQICDSGRIAHLLQLDGIKLDITTINTQVTESGTFGWCTS